MRENKISDTEAQKFFPLFLFYHDQILMNEKHTGFKFSPKKVFDWILSNSFQKVGCSCFIPCYFEFLNLFLGFFMMFR